MKKIALFAVVALIGASSFTSCSSKKDYTCSCTVGGQTVSYEMKDVKKSDAEKACEGYVVTGVECSLK